MKSYPAPPIPENTIEQVRALASTGASLEVVIQRMRDLGLGIIPSIRLVQSSFGLSPQEAKKAVHLSDAWQDCRTSNEALHEAAFSAAKELGLNDSVEQVQITAFAS